MKKDWIAVLRAIDHYWDILSSWLAMAFGLLVVAWLTWAFVQNGLFVLVLFAGEIALGVAIQSREQERWKNIWIAEAVVFMPLALLWLLRR